ncbi:hypothetical protein V2G26_016628 [Clonostachys chloroleuca]
MLEVLPTASSKWWLCGAHTGRPGGTTAAARQATPKKRRAGVKKDVTRYFSRQPVSVSTKVPFQADKATMWAFFECGVVMWRWGLDGGPGRAGMWTCSHKPANRGNRG